MTDKPIPDDEIEAIVRIFRDNDGSRYGSVIGYKNLAIVTIRALDAVRAAKSDTGWQTMETAPKDGTAVIIYVPVDWGKGYCIGEAEFDALCIHSSEPRWKWASQDDTEWFSDKYQPTHWRDLPAPPKG